MRFQDEYHILKKKKNKKSGFALTALLASIAIILLLVGLFVFLMGRVNKNKTDAEEKNSANTSEVISKDDDNIKKEESSLECNSKGDCTSLCSKEGIFSNNLRTIKDAAVSYFTNERLPQKVGETKKITLKEMYNKKLVISVVDSNKKTCSDTESYVEITKERNEYVMKVFLSCSDMKDYILIHLGCYDYCKDKICEKEVTPNVTEFEYQYKKTTACTMSPWSNWGEWKTIKEATSNLKKEDTKVETTTKTIIDIKDAIPSPTTYNCDKYSGYTLDGDKCVKKTTTTDVVDATPSTFSYNCDKYSGYTLNSSKCEKVTITEEVVDATKNPTIYYCENGYNLNGTNCEKEIKVDEVVNAKSNLQTYSCTSGYKRDDITYIVKKGDTLASISKSYNISIDAIKEVNKISSIYVGLKLSLPSKYQTVCYKMVNKTSTKDAVAIYSTKTEKQNYTCYKEECTTKLVSSCAPKICEMVEVDSCETVKKTCTKDVKIKYISGYSCSSYGSNYKLNGTKCSMTYQEKETTNATKNTITYYCEKGYTKTNDNKCVKSYTIKETISAKEKPATYSCKSDYNLNGTKCVKNISTSDIKDATKVSGGYVCNSGYTLNGTKCEKTNTNTDTKDAVKNKITYSCVDGYKLNGTECSKSIKQDIKTTYYRYATRNCTGGSTDIKWSTKDDRTLLNDGYKLTGNKRKVNVIVK